MNLVNRNDSFIYPEIINTPSDIFVYIALFNNFQYFETDLNGVVVNNILQNYFFVNKTELATPRKFTNEIQYNGFLYIGLPNDPGTDVDGEAGIFKNVVESMLSKSFLKQFQNLISCSFEVEFNNIRPLYNTNKYTLATITSGIEIQYTIWI